MHPFALKYLVYYALVVAGLGLLFSRRVRHWNRHAVLLLAFVLLGGVVVVVVPALDEGLGMHPSPMCSLTRLLEAGILHGVYPQMMLVSLAVILALSVLGKKLFCGWACPLGALQELLYGIPGVKKAPNLPFAFTNWIRTYLFAVCLAGLVFCGSYLYGPINAFELLHWRSGYTEVVLGLGLLGLAALFYYRPYCYLVCPIGWVSWILERFAILRLRFHKDRCSSCHACLEAAPCPSLQALVEERKGWLPDCTSCGLCIPPCPKGALTFGLPSFFQKESRTQNRSTRSGTVS
jgi:polyferredoxin